MGGKKKKISPLKLIIAAPWGGEQPRKGGVRDNVIESSFMSCEIERIPPTDVCYTSDSC